jgi:hypothetical protein
LGVLVAGLAAIVVTAGVALMMRGGKSVTTDTSKGTVVTPAGALGSAAASVTSPVNYEDSLRQLVDSSRIPARAADVLKKVATFEPRLKSSKELMLAATLKANVAATQGDATKACQIYKDVMPNLNASDRADVTDKLPTVGCQP